MHSVPWSGDGNGVPWDLQRRELDLTAHIMPSSNRTVRHCRGSKATPRRVICVVETCVNEKYLLGVHLHVLGLRAILHPPRVFVVADTSK